MHTDLKPGLTGDIVRIVTDDDTAASYGSGLVPVLSTPHLIALMEGAAQVALKSYLDEGESAVGISIDMKHLAATPVGMQVRVHAELIEVKDRLLRFRVEAWDEIEKVGEADHERFVIDTSRFMRRIDEKAETLKGDA